MRSPRANPAFPDQSGIMRLTETERRVLQDLEFAWEASSEEVSAEGDRPRRLSLLLEPDDLLDDDFDDEKTPTMGVRVVFGDDGEVRDVVPFQSDVPPPATIEALSSAPAIPLTRRRYSLPAIFPPEQHSASRLSRWGPPVLSAVVASLTTALAVMWWGSSQPPGTPVAPSPAPVAPAATNGSLTGARDRTGDTEDQGAALLRACVPGSPEGWSASR